MMQCLDRLLRPRSIAVIGGGAWCGYVVENCAKIGFSGPIWPVHPTRSDIGGHRAFAGIADLPVAPDAAFVGVNRVAAIPIVAELASRGAGGAVIYASGFLEAEAETVDGAELQRQLLNAAGGMTLIGPNCYGFLNYLDGAALWPDQQGGRRVDAGVALITQSSNIAINLTMQKRGLPLAYVVTAGNQAQTGLADLGQALLRDARVTALGLHVEGIADLAAFEALAAAARDCGKPIVALKAGRSEQARAATRSHTASLAGTDAGASALFARLGIAETRSLSGLLETLKLLHVTGPLASGRIASMSCSGGEASLMADAAIGRDIDYPALTDIQTRALRQALGPMVALANPLDYNTYIWAQSEKMTQTFTAMMSADLALGAVVADFPRTDRCADADWEPVIAAVQATARTTGRPMALLASLAENMPEPVAERLMKIGIAPLCGMAEAVEAIALAAWLGQTEPAALPVWHPVPVTAAGLIDEAAAKTMLAAIGVSVPHAVVAHTRSGLRAAVAEVGFPLVLKARGLAHKSEAGGVALDLRDDTSVLAAAAAMPGESFLLEEMITGALAELLVGVVCDPAHGYVLTLAAGGTATELLRDATSLLLPTDEAAIRTALRRLRIGPVLTGYRGAPAADISAIVQTVLAVQAFVSDRRGRIEEIEINPLICTPTRAVAADILIRAGEPDD